MTGLAVIGAGLSRTGTYSLKMALERLGLAPCHHWLSLMDAPARAGSWLGALQGRPVDWSALLAGHTATADLPGCLLAVELARRHPAAKVVLTVRDPQAWCESLRSTLLRPPSAAPDARLAALMAEASRQLFGDGPFDDASLIAGFERHNSQIRGGMPAGRLLVYQVREGWGPSCRFLGVPMPREPFPRSNSRSSFAGPHGSMEDPRERTEKL